MCGLIQSFDGQHVISAFLHACASVFALCVAAKVMRNVRCVNVTNADVGCVKSAFS